MEFPRTKAQGALLVALVVFVVLSALTAVQFVDLLPLWVNLAIWGITVGLFFLVIELSNKEARRWEKTHGLQPAGEPGRLAQGMSSSVSNEWSDRDDPQALIGEHRGRNVVVYQSDWSIPAPSVDQGTVVVTIAIAELQVPLPLIEVERGPGVRKPAAFGRWGKEHGRRGIPNGVTVRCDDDAYVAAVLPLILGQFPKDDDLCFAAAIDGPRVVVWGNLRDLLLKTACDIADALPQELLDRFRVKP